MNAPGELERAISLLRDGPIALADTAAARARREHVLLQVRSLVVNTPRRLRRKRQMRLAALGTLVVTSATLAWVGIAPRHHLEGAPSVDTVLVEVSAANRAVWSDGTERPDLLGTRSRVPLRGTLRSMDDAAVSLVTPLGVRVALDAQSQVGLKDLAATPRRSVLTLDRGKIRCRVPHLPAGSVFSVRARDAEVIVHGTVFTVETPRAAAAPLCVRVEEGLVEVRRGHQYRMLEAGSSFGCEGFSEGDATGGDSTGGDSTGSDSTSNAATGNAATANAAIGNAATGNAANAQTSSDGTTGRDHGAAKLASEAPRRGLALGSKHRAPTTELARVSAAPDAEGTLAEESRLLAAALVKEREGFQGKAHELFQQLVTRYPRSALATEAKAGLLRTADSR